MRVQHLHMNKYIPLVSCDSNLLTSLHCLLKCSRYLLSTYSYGIRICHGVRSQAFFDVVSIVDTRNSWASCWLPDTLSLFTGSCNKYQEKETTCMVYTHASFIADSTLWPFISGLCEDVFELQDDIAHSEAQDSLMCSAGRIPFACYQQMILYYKTQCYCIEP